MIPRWPFVALLFAIIVEVFVSASSSFPDSNKASSSSSVRPKVNRPRTNANTTNFPNSTNKSKGKDKVKEKRGRLRPVAIGPRPRHFSGRVLAIPWWDIYLRFQLAGVDELPKHVHVTPVFCSHYEMIAMPMGTFSVNINSPILYWQIPDPVELPIGDYDIVISYLDEKENVIMEHVMEINVAGLDIEVPKDPIPLEKSKTVIKIGLRNLTLKEMKCIRLILVRYQPGRDLAKLEYPDVLRDFSSRDVSNLMPGEYRMLDTRDTSFVIDPAFFGPLESGLYYVVAFDIAPRPSSIIDFEKELKSREDERVRLRGIKILKRVKKHMAENTGLPLFVSDSDSEEEQELDEDLDPVLMKNYLKDSLVKELYSGKDTGVDGRWIDATGHDDGDFTMPSAATKAAREERRARWQRKMDGRRRELKREVERTKDYVSFILGTSQPFHLYTPKDLERLKYFPVEEETFAFPNSNSCVVEGREFAVKLADRRTKADIGKVCSLDMGGLLCRNGRRDYYCDQMSAAPPIKWRKDGPVDLSINYNSIKSGKPAKASNRTNFISSRSILPRFHGVAVLGEPFPFIFKINRGLRERIVGSDQVFFRNAKVELSIPSCIISMTDCATDPHYHLLAQVPVKFDDKQLFVESATAISDLIGVNVTITPNTIPKEVLGGRNFMFRFIADVLSKQTTGEINYVRQQVIVAESRIFSIVSAEDPHPLVPDSIRMPASIYFDYYRAFHPLAHSYVNEKKAKKSFVLPKTRKSDPKEAEVPATPLDLFKSKSSSGFHPLCGLWTSEEIERMVDLSEYVRFLRNTYEYEVSLKKAIYEEDGNAFSERYKQSARRCRAIKWTMEDTYEYLEQLETKFKLDIKDLTRQLFRKQMQHRGLLTDIRNTRPHWPARLCTNIDELKMVCRNGLCATPLSDEETMERAFDVLYEKSHHFSWKNRKEEPGKEEIEELGTPDEIERAFQYYRDAMMRKTGVDIEDLKTSSSSSISSDSEESH